MKWMHLVFVAAIVLFVGRVSAEDLWDYPGPAGPSGVGEVMTGPAGKLHVFDCQTSDSIEKVVLWYAKQLRLPDDHSLVKAATQGFDKLNQSLQFGTGNDTERRKDFTYVSAQIEPVSPHISILHQPDHRQPQVVTISIVKAPKGTSIQVIQQLPAKDAQASASGTSADNRGPTK